MFGGEFGWTHGIVGGTVVTELESDPRYLDYLIKIFKMLESLNSG